ncbi:MULTISPECIES: hypothetical protein [unclassified Rhodococcus (in: high G+C Gram-positive bacteria)]|uniref:hypothetical protein n=1 Tax=unclassified Rhodococcus (in: high G+C Gram-positive bacteria) TaxID=192944 RepID=UPI001FF7DE42|nr:MULTISPECIES: hypothetical protein [unclassified Rhodococcus (in: high G+C Gram-positive bacteria)]
MGLAMNNEYSQLKGLAGVYLEDSYVLSISEAPGQFTFALDAVLTPESSRYKPPKPDEQYCYALGRLVFSAVTAVKWISRSAQQYTDATGDVDLGNIDNLSFDEGRYVAEGDWGQVEIYSSADPEFLFD